MHYKKEIITVGNCIYAWTRNKKKTCRNRVPDMTCFAAKHLKFDSSVKANCHAKGKLFICF